MVKVLTNNEKERNYFFDNLRGILILLVVMAHFISPLGKATGIKFLYRYIYIFHMPGMLFISGYFFKSSIKEGKLLKNKIFNYCFLYIVFQVIYTIINGGKFSIYQSQMGLWYIQVLIIYNLLLPVLTRIKPVICIIMCFLLGLIIGIDNTAGHVASLSRALVFLPFYMIGFYTTEELLKKLFKKRYIIIGILGLLATGTLLYFNMDKLPQLLNMSSGKASYQTMKMGIVDGVIWRTAWYLVATLMIIFLISITPRMKIKGCKIGNRTLQIFLLHIIICIILRRTNIYIEIGKYNELVVMLISLALSTMITYITSLKIFSYPFDWIMKLKFKWLLKE